MRPSRTVFTWGRFEREEHDMARVGRELLYQHGVGLAFLATTRASGAPRVHPVCPVINGDGLYAFVIPSPKRSDLLRDGRYALHSFPSPENEDAFCITGVAQPCDDAALRESTAAIWFAERDLDRAPPGFDEEQLFEFLVGGCLTTKTTRHGDYEPQHRVWSAPT
jgi:hypothetical protein